MPIDIVLIAIFMVIIPVLGRILGKPQPKEGGTTGPILTLLRMSGILLICHLGKPPPYPAFKETSPKSFLNYLLISNI